MLRRLIPPVTFAVAGLLATAPVLAAGHTIFRKSNSRAAGFPVLLGLVSGHSYRVDITSSKKHPYAVTGYENYSYVMNKRLFEKSAGVNKKGTTPGSFTVRQPHSGKLTQWLLGLQVQLTRGEGLTVRVSDLGAGH